jgi:hypothetical protein
MASSLGGETVDSGSPVRLLLRCLEKKKDAALERSTAHLSLGSSLADTEGRIARRSSEMKGSICTYFKGADACALSREQDGKAQC